MVKQIQSGGIYYGKVLIQVPQKFCISNPTTHLKIIPVLLCNYTYP